MAGGVGPNGLAHSDYVPGSVTWLARHERQPISTSANRGLKPDEPFGPEPVITTAQEFALISLQLEWLESYLRAQPPGEDSERLGDSLNALVVARALVTELTSIGNEAAPEAVEGIARSA